MRAYSSQQAALSCGVSAGDERGRIGLVAVKSAGAVFAYQLAVFNHAGESV
jgi:hypothetical protein